MTLMMNIGDAAQAAGVTPKMVRHYESLGLIPEAERTEAGYRLYGEREVAMLRFIRQSRGLGFSMKQIDELLALWRDDGRESREVKQVAMKQLAELEERQRELDQMRATLSELVAHCAGDSASHCAILNTLAQPSAPAPAVRKPARALKETRPGERRARASGEHRGQQPQPRPEPAHRGLMAWAHAAAQTA
jgi:Cu(I)-responsive transcriptional regulator